MRWRKALGWLGVLLLVLGLASSLLAIASKRARPKLAPNLLARAAEAPCQNVSTPPVVDVSWTGIAGVRIEVCTSGSPSTLLVDPYVTRHNVPELLFPVDSDSATLARAFPHADVILVGHAHHDHLGDVADVALRTGATVVGSRTACHLAASMGLPAARCRIVEDENPVALGTFVIEAIPNPHARTWVGVPFTGEVGVLTRRRRPFVWEMKMGTPQVYVIRTGGKVLYHQSTAGLSDSQLQRLSGLQPDLAMVSVALRDTTPDYATRLLGALAPRHVMPIHQDDFLGPMLRDDGPLLVGVDLEAFEREATAPGRAYVVRRPFERWRVP